VKNKMLNISIVLYKNNPAQITNLLEDIFNSHGIEINAIYLVDNSPDNHLQSLKNLDPRIEYIAAPHNPGYGAAHNLAIKKSIERYVEYHLVVNPDIRFSSTELAKLINFMQQRNDVGLVMPRVIYPDGKVQHLCKLLPNPFNIFARRFMPRSYIDKMNYNYTLQWTDYNKLMQVPYLSGSFMLFRVNDLQQIGSFDERFFMYFEDTDITRRFYRDAKAWFYPDATVTHEHNQESYRSLKMLWVHIQNMIRYFSKYGWFIDLERQQINKQINSQRTK
jgi:GT2 family glycosyltransferase